MSISDERLAELIGLGCDGIARHEACALATEVQALRAAAKVRAIREGDGLDTLLAQRQPSGLPKAYGGCTCSCHRTPGVMHIAPCCRPSDDTSPLITREWAERMIPLEDGVDVTNAPAMTPTDNLEAGAGDLVKPKGAGDGSLERQYREAAAQLVAVTAENARLREALEPFARIAVHYIIDTTTHLYAESEHGRLPMKRLWFRRARALLSQEAPK